LSVEERERLEVLIRNGKSPASRLLKARILLKADVSEMGEGWSDSRIMEALDASPSMVYRVRKQSVEEGLGAVLSRKQRAMPAIPPIFDGEHQTQASGGVNAREMAAFGACLGLPSAPVAGAVDCARTVRHDADRPGAARPCPAGMSARRMAVELTARGIAAPSGSRWHAQGELRMIDRARC
jgi:hypothetical protein